VSGLWLVSYVALWLLVLSVGSLQAGVLREIGMLRRRGQSELSGPTAVSPIEDDGPVIGSDLPALVVNASNGHGSFALRQSEIRQGTLVVFLSPLCEGCQDIVGPLNRVLKDGSRAVRAFAILRGSEHACRAFERVFPLGVPSIWDTDDAIASAFGMHHTPAGLLYDERGALVRKGLVQDGDDLAALLGDASAPAQAMVKVFPRPDAGDRGVRPVASAT
jgi:hypothetical protein